MSSSIAHRLGAAFVCGAVCAIWACARGSHDDGGTSIVDPDAGPETSAGSGSCGQQGEACCADGGCAGISYCAKTNLCESHPTDVGQPCNQGSQCMSGTCTFLQGTGAAGVCTEPCLSASDCVPGWTCDHVGQPPDAAGNEGQGVCGCTPATEACDGRDNNCDGKIDEEPGADEACTIAAGVPKKCVGGACVCVTVCGDAGACTDLTQDTNNCGACGHACLPGLQVCASSECVCAGVLCPLPAAGDAGYLVADGGPDGGPAECVLAASDPNNCGACGVVCPSPYPCQNGACQGVVLVQGDATNSVTTAISDGTNVFVLASVGGSVSNAIEECAVTGCNQQPTTVSSGPTPILGVPVVGGSWVYWANATAVEDLATAQPAATPFAQPTGSSIYGVATNSTHVFWSDQNLGIFACAIGSTCASPTTLLDLASISGPPYTIAADETYVYWIDGTFNLFSSPVAGGTPSTLATDASTYGSMVAVAGRVYYVGSNGGIGTAVGGTASSGATYVASLGATSLATDGTSLYWADDQNQIKKCQLGPSCATPTVVANASSPTWVAVDGAHTYWIAMDANGNSNVYEYEK